MTEDTSSESILRKEFIEMGLLTREQILNASDIKTEIVAVPEWGGSVNVRGLTGYERDYFERSMIEQKGKELKLVMNNVRASLVQMTVVDDKGVQLFSDADVAALGKKSAAALDRVFEVAQRLSGLTDDDVKELEKNLGNAQNEDSTSD